MDTQEPDPAATCCAWCTNNSTTAGNARRQCNDAHVEGPCTSPSGAPVSGDAPSRQMQEHYLPAHKHACKPAAGPTWGLHARQGSRACRYLQDLKRCCPSRLRQQHNQHEAAHCEQSGHYALSNAHVDQQDRQRPKHNMLARDTRLQLGAKARPGPHARLSNVSGRANDSGHAATALVRTQHRGHHTLTQVVVCC